MINKVALTSNGNQYKKSNTGKIVGNIPTAALLGMGIHNILTKNYNHQVIKPKSYLATIAVLCSTLGLVGTAIGTFIDNGINKNRMAQADGEAKLNKKV